MAFSTNQTTVAEISQAAYGRVLANEGLDFYAAHLAAGTMTAETLMAEFMGNTEAGIRYPDTATDAATVQQVFNNVLGRDAAQTGVDFYSALLADGTITKTTLVTMILADAKGLSGGDAAFINAAVAAGETAYDAAVAAAAASAAAAAVAADIAAVADANDAKVAFLVTADGDDDATTTALETDIAANETAALIPVNAIVAGYTAASTGVRAALLVDEQTANATAVTAAATAVADANADIAAVTGLTQAIATLTSAEAATEAATTVVATATANLAGALATYVSYNGAQTLETDGTDSAGVDTLIQINTTTGALELVSGVTETTNPGVTALLNASIAKEAADAALLSATGAETAAIEVVEYLDLTAAAKVDAAAVGAGMTVVTPADAALPTQGEIATETASLAALHTTAISALKVAFTAITWTSDAQTETDSDALLAAALADGHLSAGDVTAIDAAYALVAANGSDLAAQLATAITAIDANNTDAAGVAFAGLVATYDASATSGTAVNADNPLYSALDTANTAVAVADLAVADLADAVADLVAAEAAVADLAALNTAIADAEAVFTDAGLLAPVSVATGINYATAGDDIFLADDTIVTSSISNFNLLGTDTLYIGTDYTVNTGALTTGDNSVLEAFLSEVAGNAVISLETSVFSSDSSDAEAVITLTGVALADITAADGFISIA